MEAILRISFVKTNESQKSYAATLEEIFSNPNLDMKNRWAKDPFLKHVYDDEDVSECFRTHEILLVALFERRGINRGATYVELEKSALIQLLKEANVIRAPEKKKVDAEKKEEKKGGKKAAPKEEAKDKEEKKEE